MDVLSERLRTAVGFLKENGYAKNDSEIAGRLRVKKSTLCMNLNGTRTPTWGLLLDFCDQYPINFGWLRTGSGSMIKEDREAELLKKIEGLEERLRLLEGKGAL